MASCRSAQAPSIILVSINSTLYTCIRWPICGELIRDGYFGLSEATQGLGRETPKLSPGLIL